MTQRQDFKVFISSTSADLGPLRDDIGRYMRDHVGAATVQQTPEPGATHSGPAIRRAIDEADLVICLVGNVHGATLAEGAPGDDIPEGLSWTQWELLYAVESYLKKAQDETRPIRAELLVLFADEGLDPKSEPEALRGRQKAFRQSARDRLEKLFGMPFYRSFNSYTEALDRIRHEMERSGGQIDRVMEARWATFLALYRSHWQAQWEAAFPGRALSAFGQDRTAWFAPGSDLFALDRAPLIDMQRFGVIVPEASGVQMAQVKQGAEATKEDVGFSDLLDLILGRAADDSLEARRRPGDGTGRGKRLVLVNAAGLGKTTTLKRLQYEINKSADKLALYLDVDAFRDVDDAEGLDTNLRSVIARAVDNLGIKWEKLGLDNEGATQLRSRAQFLQYGVKKHARDGRLVLLIDGLDHFERMPDTIGLLQNRTDWAGTDVVLSGRPAAFGTTWTELGDPSSKPFAPFWRFLFPLRLKKDEAKAYLGGVDMGGGRKVWRYDLVYRHFGDELLTPRLLEHIRRLGAERLQSARTASDVYCGAADELLQVGLQTANEVPTTEECLRMLAALAFESMFDPRSGNLRRNPNKPRSFRIRTSNDTIVRRLAPFYPGNDEQRLIALRDDLKKIRKLSTFVGNGLIEETSGENGEIRWVSRTVQHFLAAYWLAAYAPADLRPHDNELESDWFRRAQFYPHDEHADDVEEFNRFLAEMPISRIDAASWLAAIRVWYDPFVERRRAEAVDTAKLTRRRLWPTEMIARSWRTLHALADEPIDDWWDIPYEALEPLTSEGRHNPLHDPDEPPAQDGVYEAAREVLDGFFGDFQMLLDRSPAGSTAHRFATEGWKDIPGGELRMGSPEEQQGFPAKIRAFWEQHVPKALAANDDEALKKLARDTSPDAWWSGPYGRRAQDEEISWLIDHVYKPYRSAAAQGAAAEASALKLVMKRLQDNFRRADETPLDEGTQPVGPFTLNEIPVTNEIYALFAPGHVEDTRSEIRGAQDSHRASHAAENRRPMTGEGDHRADDWADPKRPAVYIEWFDAWAFAQWARWETGGTKYRCRLPHEPEWEWACKRKPLQGGGSTESEFGERYWWGQDFYDRPEEPVEESISKRQAHAFGWPGATRPPASADPNGYGLKDMIGNVWEWQANIYDERSENEIKDDEENTGYSRYRPSSKLPPINAPRVIRGGLWWYLNHIASAASRFRLEPTDGDYKTGFRLVRDAINS